MIKISNPVTPSQRHKVSISRSCVYKGSPEKSLVRGLSSKGGRNNLGRITVRHQGGGHKRSYRLIDFKRNKVGEYIVERIEYDPNRSCFISLVRFLSDSSLSYILAPEGLEVGMKIRNGVSEDVQIGNIMEIRAIPVGTEICHIELSPGGGAKLVRSAGAGAKLVSKGLKYCSVKLVSGEVRRILSTCRCMIGHISNINWKNRKLGKAGVSRWLGVRPSVRGVVMNPIDHPHGGGEGKTSGGRHPVNFKGKPTKGKKTRSRRKSTDHIIKRRV